MDSRTKQALINICAKLGVHHLIFSWLSSPTLEHVTLSLSPSNHSSVVFLLSSLGSSHSERSCTRKTPTVKNASFRKPLLLPGCALGGSAVSMRRRLPTNCSVSPNPVLTLGLAPVLPGLHPGCPPTLGKHFRRNPTRPPTRFLFPSLHLSTACCRCSLQMGKSAWQILPTLGPLILLITMTAAGN